MLIAGRGELALQKHLLEGRALQKHLMEVRVYCLNTSWWGGDTPGGEGTPGREGTPGGEGPCMYMNLEPSKKEGGT